MSGQNKKKAYSSMLSKKLSRRQAISTTAKIGVAAVAGVVVGSIGGWLAGSQLVKPATVTMTQTIERTVTETVTKREEITKTITAPATTVSTTPAKEDPYMTDPEGWFKDLKGVTIRIAEEAGRMADAIEYIKPDFEKMTGAKIEVGHFPADTFQHEMRVEATQRTGAWDAFETWDIGFFAGGGHVIPLDDYIKDDPYLNFDDIKDTIQYFEWKGHYYMLPYNPEVFMVYYRRDILEEHGITRPPRTWDEWLDMIKEVHNPDKKIYGIAFTASRFWHVVDSNFWSFLWSNGGRVINEDWEPAFNDEKGLEALEFMIELAKYGPPGIYTYEYMDVNTAFCQGLVVFANQWTPLAFHAEDPKMSKVVGKGGATLFPVGPHGDKPHSPAGGWGHAIFVSCDKPEKVYKFLSWITSPTNQKRMIAYNGVLPNRASVLKDPEIAKYAVKPFKHEWAPNGSYFECLSNAFKLGYRVVLPEISAIVQEGAAILSEALQGKISAKEALNTWEQKVKEILKEAGYSKATHGPYPYY